VVRRSGLCILAFAAVALVARGWGEVTPERVKEIEARIGYLANPDAHARRGSLRALIETGPEALPFLHKAIDERRESEIKLLCKAAVVGISLKQKTPARPAQVSKPDGSHVTIQVTDARLSDILWQLTEQSGNAPVLAWPDGPEKPLTFEVTDLPYWRALEKLCDLTGLALEWDNDSPIRGLGLLKSQHEKPPAVCSGPVAVRLEGVGIRRAFRPDSEESSLTLTFDLLWEDRLPVESASVVIGSLLTKDGRRLTSGAKPKLHMHEFGGPKSGGGFELTVDKFPGDVEGIAVLSGTVTLKMPEETGGPRSYEFVLTDLPIR